MCDAQGSASSPTPALERLTKTERGRESRDAETQRRGDTERAGPARVFLQVMPRVTPPGSVLLYQAKGEGWAHACQVPWAAMTVSPNGTGLNTCLLLGHMLFHVDLIVV